MIIWSGFGFLVAVIVFGCCLIANFVLDAQFGEDYYSTHPWAVGTALGIGGMISSWIGFALKGRTDRIVVDEETGERLVMNESNHTIFFIPMHWAGILIGAIGLSIAIFDVFT